MFLFSFIFTSVSVPEIGLWNPQMSLRKPSCSQRSQTQIPSWLSNKVMKEERWGLQWGGEPLLNTVKVRQQHAWQRTQLLATNLSPLEEWWGVSGQTTMVPLGGKMPTEEGNNGEKQARGSFEKHACFDGSTLYWLVKNHFFSRFIHWPDLFLSKPFSCLVLSTLHHVFASIGQVSSLTPPLPCTSPPAVFLFKEKQNYNGEWWDYLNYTADKVSPARSSLEIFYSIAI